MNGRLVKKINVKKKVLFTLIETVFIIINLYCLTSHVQVFTNRKCSHWTTGKLIK